MPDDGYGNGGYGGTGSGFGGGDPGFGATTDIGGFAGTSGSYIDASMGLNSPSQMQFDGWDAAAIGSVLGASGLAIATGSGLGVTLGAAGVAALGNAPAVATAVDHAVHDVSAAWGTSIQDVTAFGAGMSIYEAAPTQVGNSGNFANGGPSVDMGGGVTLTTNWGGSGVLLTYDANWYNTPDPWANGGGYNGNA